MTDFITSIRKLLIKFGKVLPFILCFVVCVSYSETLFAMITDRLVFYADFAIPYTPLSYYLASIFEYDWLTIVAITILSYAINTCLWNKLSIFYIAFQLVFKNFIADFEIEPTYIYLICLANILVASFLTYHGLNIFLKK